MPLLNPLSCNAVHLNSKIDEVAAAQTEEFMLSLQSPSLTFQKFGSVWYETSTGTNRLVVPEQFRYEMIRAMHTLGHFGTKRTARLLTAQYFWPRMRKDAAAFVKSCRECALYKPTKVAKRAPIAFANTDRFRVVHIDIVGPLPSSRRGHQYILTMIDRTTRWLEAIPISNISAEACAHVFVSHWVCRFGVPDTVVSDQGTQFESTLFGIVLKRLGSVRSRTTPYHPQSNGRVERAHRTLKDILRCSAAVYEDWEEALPFALLAMRVAIGENGFSPSQLVFGESLALPSDMVGQPPASYAEDNFVLYKTLSSQINMFRQFLSTAPHRLTDDFAATEDKDATSQLHALPAKNVYIVEPLRRNTLAPRYLGPFRVVEFRHPVVTVDRDGTLYRVNVDRTKPAWTLHEVAPVCEGTQELLHTEAVPEQAPLPLPIQLEAPPAFPLAQSRYGRTYLPVDRFQSCSNLMPHSYVPGVLIYKNKRQ